jgi:hypothetical protein
LRLHANTYVAILPLERVWLINNAKHPLPALVSSYDGAYEVGNYKAALPDRLPGRNNRSEYVFVMISPGNLNMQYWCGLESNRKKREFLKRLRPPGDWHSIQHRGTGINE